MPHTNDTALVTGANSGIGFEAAAQLAEKGYGRVILACRNAIKAETAKSELIKRTGRDIFDILIVDVASYESTLHAADILSDQPVTIDLLILNAGAGAQSLKKSQDGIEMILASTLFGHHILTMKLLEAGKLSSNAHIIIAGSEAARGEAAMPGMKDMLFDYPGYMLDQDIDLDSAMDIVARGEHRAFDFNKIYSNAKVWVVWWAAYLSRQLPNGMFVATVSPGSAPGTSFVREMPAPVRFIVVPLMRLIGPLFKLAGPVSNGAKRYVDAAEFGIDVSGKFFASPEGAMIGPLEVQLEDHYDNQVMQQATWDALVRLTGVGLPTS